jgi:hypothetical protein
MLLISPRRFTPLASFALTLTLACGPRGDQSTERPDDVEQSSSQDDRPGLALNEARMFAVLEHLASDDMAGRHSLGPKIHEAASFIASRYAEMGVAPVGKDYLVSFPLITGARIEGEQKVVLHAGKRRPRALAVDAFTPVAEAGSGHVRGPVVFAGYVAKAAPIAPDEDDEGDEGRPGYDDLEGIDLAGKVALVLLDTPGRPDLRTLFSRLQREVESFDAAAKPLREAKDEAGMRKLHKRARERIADLIEPFMRGEKVPDAIFELPEDPLSTDLDLQSLLAPIVRKAQQMPGPQFGFGEAAVRQKLERVAEAGAVGAILVRGPRSFLGREEREADALPDLQDAGPRAGGSVKIPAVQVRWKTADKLFRIGGKRLSQLQREIDLELEPRSRDLPGMEAELTVKTEPIADQIPNVLATIPGLDLAHEVVLLASHYDHLGMAEAGGGTCVAVTDSTGKKDTICNGADDNASGTAMVVEVARAFAESGIKPRRSLVFASFAGEELGLWGSRALVDKPIEAPPLAGGKVVAVVNLDMVGRLGPRGLAIGGLSSSPDWMPLLDDVGTAGIEVTYERSVANRGDHVPFYEKKIPVLFFFTHVHKDYHRAGDHADRINREGMAKVGEIVAGVVVKLAAGHSVAFSEPKTEAEGLTGNLPGADPDTVEKRVKAH